MENMQVQDPPDKNYHNPKKEIAIRNICNMIDSLYIYAKKIIPKDITHKLGYMKEIMKEQVEILILRI